MSGALLAAAALLAAPAAVQGSGAELAASAQQSSSERSAGQPSSGRADAQGAEPAAKPVAAFEIGHELDGPARVGEPLTVRLTLRPREAIDDVTVRVAADARLDVTGPELLTAASATAEAPAEWAVTVVPRDEGRLRLRVHGEGVIDGRRQARSVVVPIPVSGQGSGDAAQGRDASKQGAGDAAEESARARDASGDDDAERVIRLPSSAPER